MNRIRACEAASRTLERVNRRRHNSRARLTGFSRRSPHIRWLPDESDTPERVGRSRAGRPDQEEETPLTPAYRDRQEDANFGAAHGEGQPRTRATWGPIKAFMSGTRVGARVSGSSGLGRSVNGTRPRGRPLHWLSGKARTLAEVKVLMRNSPLNVARSGEFPLFPPRPTVPAQG
jgi:hypothetical protein